MANPYNNRFTQLSITAVLANGTISRCDTLVELQQVAACK